MKNILALNKKHLLAVFFIVTGNFLYSQVIFIGPTLHYNIGGEIKQLSWGVELSYWHWEHFNDIPMGADLGIEFEHKKTRIYSEFQVGIVFGGSLGMVYEISDIEKNLGFQSSAWAAYFGGAELRYRRIDEKNYFSPGIFLKAPIFDNSPKLNFGGGIFNNLM